MYVCFFLSVGYKNSKSTWAAVLKTKQHQYFFAWVGVLIDVVATGGYWSDYCYTGWRDWNWVSLLPCSHRWPPTPHPPPPPPPLLTHTLKHRDGSYKIWQLQEGLLINLECSSEGRVMAGEEEKEWLLPLNLYLSFSMAPFLPPSVFPHFSFLRRPSPVILATDYLNNHLHFPLFLLLFFPPPS